MSNYATVWYGVVATGAGPITAGLAVVPVGDGTYAVATAANRALYGRSVGIARTTADSGKSFQFQVAGPASIASLGTGLESDYARVDANGAIERVTSPGASDDLIGRCPGTGAVMMVQPVLSNLSSAYVAPTGTGYPRIVAGVQQAAAIPIPLDGGATHVTGTLPAGNGGTGQDTSASTGVPMVTAGTWSVAANVAVGNGYIAIGANPAEAGAVRLSSGEFVASEGDGAEYELIGLVNDVDGDHIEIGNDAGIPVRISAGALDPVHLVGQEIFLEANAWVLGDDVDVDPSLSTGAGAPGDVKPDGSIYLRTDGTGSTGIYTRQGGAWEAVGGGAPGGSDNQLQYNNGGALGGAAITYNEVSGGLDIPTAGAGVSLPGAGSYVSLGSATSYLSFGASPATEGTIRFPYAATAGPSIRARNSSDAENLHLIQFHADNLFIGTGGAFTGATQVTSISMYCNTAGALGLGLGGGTFQYIIGSRIEFWMPRLGSQLSGTPYASDGRATQAMADADQTLGASVYSRAIVMCTGALTAARTITFPHPATEDTSYQKVIYANVSGGNIVVSTGTGGTVVVTPGLVQHVMMTPSGVTAI